MTKRLPFIKRGEGANPERFSYMPHDTAHYKHSSVTSVNLKAMTARRVLFNDKNNLPICYDKNHAAVLPNTKKSLLDFGKVPARTKQKPVGYESNYTPEPPSSFVRPRGKVRMDT